MAEQHEKALAPQIRFTGFTDPWEQRKLGELSNEFKSGEFICADNVSVSGPYPVYGGNGLRGYTTTFNHEGLYTLIGRQGALCGNVNIADGKSYFTEHAVAVKANHLNDTTFLYYLFGTLDLGQYSGQSAQPGLAVSNLVEVEAMVPDKAEQKKISRVFKTVDSLITLHQRKYDKLCVLKKSMLDKMFPKGGSLYPQIRFAGFTDPWEQRKLGELFEEHSEKDRDDLPALTIIQGGGTVHRDESNRNLQFDRNSLSNYKVVDTGDFIVHLRSFEGGLEKATCCGLVSPAYHIFRGKNVDSDFYYLYFRSKRFIDADLKPHVYGIRDGRSIDIEGMKTIFIPWTNLAEQRRIGAFFDHLDSLITLHQRKLELLRNIKKSMLDKMFV